MKYFYFPFQTTFARCQFLYCMSNQLLTGQIPKWELGCWPSVQITVSWQPEMVSSDCPASEGNPWGMWGVSSAQTILLHYKKSHGPVKYVTKEETQPVFCCVLTVVNCQNCCSGHELSLGSVFNENSGVLCFLQICVSPLY